MKPGQTRVFVLLIVLGALEMIIHPGIKSWLAAGINGINSGLTSFGGTASGKPDTLSHVQTKTGVAGS